MAASLCQEACGSSLRRGALYYIAASYRGAARRASARFGARRAFQISPRAPRLAGCLAVLCGTTPHTHSLRSSVCVSCATARALLQPAFLPLRPHERQARHAQRLLTRGPDCAAVLRCSHCTYASSSSRKRLARVERRRCRSRAPSFAQSASSAPVPRWHFLPLGRCQRSQSASQRGRRPSRRLITLAGARRRVRR